MEAYWFGIWRWISRRGTTRLCSSRETERPCGDVKQPASAAHLDAGPLLVDLGDAGEVRVGAVAGLRDAEHLEHLRAHGHGHALRIGFLEAQAHVLIREARREAEIERAGQDGAGELVLSRRVAAAARVDDLAHLADRKSTRLNSSHLGISY